MEETEKPLSLADRLALATQTKTPGKDITPTMEATTTPPQPANVQSNFDDWNSSDDFAKPDKTEPTPGTTTPGQTTTTPAVKPPSVAEMRSGARSFAAGVNMAQRLAFTNLSKSKALKPFSQEDKELIDKIDFMPKALLNESAQALLSKFHKNMRRHDKNVKNIPFTDQELKDWELVLMMYQEETGKPLPQWLFAALTALTTLGKRGFEIYLD